MLDIATIDALEAMDAADQLRHHREAFRIPDGITYLDGNSLGCLPYSAWRRSEAAILSEWGEGLIRSWLEADWLTLSAQAGDRIGRLVGAAAGQVVAADSTSINLYKVVSAALRLRPNREVILTDRGNFPTDLYILDSVAELHGKRVRRVDAETLRDAVDADVAAVVLTHVDYRSSAVLDMAGITAATQAAGALAIWDLAHTAGAVPCELDRWNVDFAVGCGYKFLNGGPGAPGFLYAAHRHQAHARQPLQGWFGHVAPFDFADGFQPAPGIERFLCGTPSVVALSVLDGALDAFDGVEMGALYAKSQAMVAAFLDLFEAELVCRGFELASGRHPDRHGSHVAIRHAEGYRMMRALSDRGFIGDFRTPDVMRFGFAPLYNRFAEIGALVRALVEVVDRAEWQRSEYAHRYAVT